MKHVIRALAIMLAFVFVCSPVGLAESAMNCTGYALLETIYDGAHNCAVSPVSLSLALAMASEGAAGETKAQIDGLTGLIKSEKAESLQTGLRNRGVQIANALFAADDLPLREAWLSAIETTFGSRVFRPGEEGDLDAWVKEQTNGLIERAPAAPNESTRLALLNTIAMDMEWDKTFSADDTKTGRFFAPDGIKYVPFMAGDFGPDVFYGARDGAVAVCLKYAKSWMSMLLILPAEGSMQAMLKALAEEGPDWFYGKEEWILDAYPYMGRDIRLKLPKVDFKVSNDLSAPLSQLGLSLAFTGAADFSGISEEKISIGGILQDVSLQIDEKGTKAAAVTETIYSIGIEPNRMEPVEVVFDRPFLALIMYDNNLCFAAVVADPTEH